MEFFSGFAASITRDLVCGAVNELRYPCCFNNLVEDLQKEKDRVAETRNSVQERIDHAKKQTKKTTGLVHTWLKEANTGIGNAEELLKKARTNKSCCFGHCPNWIRRYRLGKQLLSERKRMIKICNEEGSNYAQFERLASLPGLGYFTSNRGSKFGSRQDAYEQLKKALESDKDNMIGLYGMWGCGKTTLAIDVSIIAKERFDEVIFVDVTSTVEVQRIQEDIASCMQLELKEKNEMQRAQRLHKRLIEEKFLVILDNVWEPLDFVAIGIPSWKTHKGCKVLITTRSKNVCIEMDCQIKISLEPLTDEEAWDLFKIQAHISEATSDNLKQLARQISNECKGLPAAIAAVASTLKGKVGMEWKVALGRLTSSEPVNIEKGLQKAYKYLQLSYDNLDTKEAKSLFLLCSVFPEEYEIPVEDLTRFAIGLGLIGEIHSYDLARNEVCAAITKLINSCLLLDAGEGKCVKMHDLIRKVALCIAEYEGKGVRCLEKEVTAEYTLLRYLWCEKFPCPFDCSNLEFLCINTYLEVSDEIFKRMKRLRVLFLINKGLEKRPLLIKSFQSSTNLRCLLLENWELSDISFVGDSEKLECLTLRKCSFLELPYLLVTHLPRLRLLDLSDCDMERNPFEVIGRHPQLEELHIDDCRSEWDLYEESTADLFSMFSVPQALQRYHIHLGTKFVEYEKKLLNCCRTLFLSCFDTSNAAIKYLASKTEVLRIANIQGGGAKNIVPDIFQIDGGGMNALIELMIRTSEDIEHLVDTGNHLSQVGTLLSGLCKLRIEDMEHLRSLYNGQPPNGLFKKLEELYIEDCPELYGTLFVWKLDLCSLKVLELYTCSKLTSLFTPAVARSLVQLERLEILYCDELKHILEDDDKEEISKNDDKLVLSKLKQITVRGCSKLEYIIPVTFACGLQQLECLEIDFNTKLKYVFGQCKYDNQSHNEIKIDLPLLEKLILVNLPDIISLCPKNCNPVLSMSSLCQFTLVNCPEVAITSINTLMVDLEGKQCEDFTSIPSAPPVNHNSGSLNLCNLKRLILRSCSMLRALFSPSTAIHLTSLEELMIDECHELRYLVTYGKAHEDKGEIIQEDHDSQSYVAMFPRLERISVVNCNLLECIFHVSYVQGLVELKVIEIQQTPSLIYVFGHSIHDNDGVPSFHQCQNKIQIELPTLEKVALVSLPNMINICPDNYYVKCSSLQQVVMEDVGLSTLSVNNLMVYSGSTYLDDSSTSDIMEASMTNVPVLGSVAISNSSKIEGIFHQDEIPMNGQQATSWLIALKLINLPELAYIWKGAKHFATLQNLKSLYIWGCQKLKVIFSSSVSRSLPQLKILVVRQCEGLQQIVEDDGEHENESNIATAPKISFSKLKLLLVTECDNLKCLFNLSTPHEFPELEYLIINEDPNLEEVFEGEQGVREGNVEVLLPELKHVILTQLPNLNSISQWIESQTLTNLFVHNCPKLSLTSMTTAENMLQIFSHDKEIDFIVHCDLLYMCDIVNKESDEKDQTASEFSNSELRRQSTTSLATPEHKIPSLKLVDQQSTSAPSFLDQQHELGETIVAAEVAQISTIFIPTHDSIQEGSTSEVVMKATLSDSTEGNGLDVVIVTHTKPSGGRDMLAQQSHVDDSIQEGSNLMDKEGETRIVSNGIIEFFPAASADTGRSHSLTTAELRAYKDFDDMDDEQIALLDEAITLYPHLWNVCDKFSKRFQALMLKTLADMLMFLRNESPISVTLTPQRENEFHRLCDEAVQLGFDKSWVDGMRQRVTVRVPEVDHALARLGELLKRNEQLTQELHEIKSEIDNLNDFLAAQERCFDFL